MNMVYGNGTSGNRVIINESIGQNLRLFSLIFLSFLRIEIPVLGVFMIH